MKHLAGEPILKSRKTRNKQKNETREDERKTGLKELDFGSPSLMCEEGSQPYLCLLQPDYLVLQSRALPPGLSIYLILAMPMLKLGSVTTYSRDSTGT